MTSKKIMVSFSLEELVKMGARADRMIIERMRSRGIPVKGATQFKGVRSGIIRVAYDKANERRTIEWWPSREAAINDGVDVPPEPGESRHVSTVPTTTHSALHSSNEPVVLPGADGYDECAGDEPVVLDRMGDGDAVGVDAAHGSREQHSAEPSAAAAPGVGTVEVPLPGESVLLREVDDAPTGSVEE